jgi:diadenosine tetraphosphate (Ap4A) HIT family hydrolase
MNQEFKLDIRLKNDGEVIAELDLCKLILVNNANFPWVILVPKYNNLKEIIDLTKENQILLMNEISYISTIMKELFQPDKLNVAALGNIVKQLHIHIIARFENDASWPDPVFGKEKKTYSSNKYTAIINKIRKKLKKEI